MTERHHYKYVVLDSSKENGNAVQAKFNVQIPHGITNASRVCVKSFSMPNGDKGVVVLHQFFYFYLFSEGPHGARLPSFSSESPVKRVDLNTPLGFVRPTSKVKFSRLGEST